jgi:arsenite methyltransferase
MLKNFRLNMLNREAASPKNKSSKIIENIDIKKGDTIADIGTGGGYFAFKFSNEVGIDGKVYAVDTDQKSLDFINDKSKLEKLNNIMTVLVNENGISLPEKIDAIFLRNVFHHLPKKDEYFKNIKRYLKKEGKIIIIDYKKRGFSFTGIFGHYTPEEDLICIMERAGFSVFKQLDFLPEQSFIVFKIKNELKNDS